MGDPDFAQMLVGCRDSIAHELVFADWLDDNGMESDSLVVRQQSERRQPNEFPYWYCWIKATFPECGQPLIEKKIVGTLEFQCFSFWVEMRTVEDYLRKFRKIVKQDYLMAYKPPILLPVQATWLSYRGLDW